MSHSELSDRFLELVIQRSIIGLPEAEQQEFEELACQPAHLKEAARFEVTAAALDQALEVNSPDEMPREIQDQLLIAAGEFFSGTTKMESVSEPKVELANRSRIDETPGVEKTSRGSRWREVMALAVAAASLLLLISGFNPFSNSPNVAAAQTPAQRLAVLTSANPADLIDLAWTPMHDNDAGGKVVWSDSRQEGYMVFENLDVNDPMLETYQLWIFDTNKAQKMPIDGGVFDISAAEFAAGKVIVPIKPNLRISKAVQFAVTVEKRPGVVVSDRNEIPVIATVD